jgi:hypothetical protein
MDKISLGIFYCDRERYEAEQDGHDISDLDSDKQIRNRCFPFNIFGAITRWLVSWYLSKQRFFHVEIAFFKPELAREGKCVAYGVNAAEGLVRKERTFGKGSYDWICMDICDEEKVKRVRMYCEQEEQKSIVYDTRGAQRTCLWPRKPLEGKSWCVAFVVNALQQADILKGYNGETLDCDDVISMLQQHPFAKQILSPHQLKQVTSENFLFSLS